MPSRPGSKQRRQLAGHLLVRGELVAASVIAAIYRRVGGAFIFLRPPALRAFRRLSMSALMMVLAVGLVLTAFASLALFAVRA